MLTSHVHTSRSTPRHARSRSQDRPSRHVAIAVARHPADAAARSPPARAPRRSRPIRRRPRSPSPRSSRATSPSGTSSPAASKPSTPSPSGRACPGYVSAVRFEEGAMVRRGDPLFQIDPRPFEAEADRLRAELARARATVQRAKSELRARRPPRERERDVARGAGAARRRSREESAAQVAAVEAALRAAELNLEFTQRDRRRSTAASAARSSRQGNLVSSGPGEATLLTTVVSLDPIYASFDADEQTFLALRGDRARARPARTGAGGAADSPGAGQRPRRSRARAS